MRKLLLPRGAVNAVYLPYLQSPRRYQIFFGGASSGKSCFLATRAVLDTLQGRSTLVIRQVARTLRTSCWNEIGKAAARLGLTGCFRFNKTEMTVTARNNGAQILFAGLDDVEKIKSISPAGGALTDIWIEEATEISYADFKQLDKRLRGQSRHEKRLTLSFNPVYKTHWIYREFFGGWDEGGRAYQSDTVSILKTTYPAQEAAFPCAVIYESGNAVQARCDGRAHLHALEYTVEIWAFSLGETHALSVRADEALASLGLSRSACTDLYDEDLRVHRRVLRYRALCDENGVLTQ